MSDDITEQLNLESNSSRFAKSIHFFKNFFSQSTWIGFAVILVIFFTFIKIPDSKIKNYTQGNIQSILAPHGISISMEESELSWIFGPKYSLSHVTLYFPNQQITHLEKLSISPSFFSLFIGKLGVNLFLAQKSNSKTLSEMTIQARTGVFKQESISLDIQLSNFDFGKLGVFNVLGGFSGNVPSSGNIEISGNLLKPDTLVGAIDLKLKSIIFHSQNIQGFNIPKLSITEGKIHALLESKKIEIKTFQIGKTENSTDDLTALLSGNISLGQTWEQSQLNIKADFGLSQSVLKSFGLLDALLAPGKVSTGSYRYQLGGSLLSPLPTPAK